jgi:ATP-dependent Zn protease
MRPRHELRSAEGNLVLDEKREILDALAALLEEKEVISGEEVEELIKKMETAS